MKGIERLIAALSEADLIAEPQASMLKLAAEDVADILWLLLYIEQKQGRQDEVVVGNTFLSRQETTPESREPLPTQAEEKVRIPLEAEVTRHVYLPSQHSRLLQESSATLFRVPAASALPESLDIARALRPFMRRIPSRTNTLIDERATAHRIAETQKGIWTPILKAAPMRWLEIALVIDCGESMAPWWQTIDELRILLEHHGAFRDVRIWRLATNARDQLHLYAGGNANSQQERNPKELIDPTGRRLILVVTDSVSPAWHSGKAQQLLDLWGHRNVVTIVQVFPKRLWTRTALCNADIVQVHATSLNRGNAGMAVRGDEVWFDEKIGDQETSIIPFLPIPVVTLEPRALSNWANMIVGTKNTWTLGAVFYQNLPSMPSDAPFVANDTSSPRELVQQFRAVASTMACKLLNLLSAAPISFPVIRLIQQAMLPQAQQVHVAEIFLSGLLEEVFHNEATNDPDSVEYDFLPGVREVIRETVPIPDEFQVIEVVSTFLGSRYGHLRDFYALATTPSLVKLGGFSITKDSRPFAKIVASVWHHLGGMYESLADQLEQYVDASSTEEGQNILLPTEVLNTPTSSLRDARTNRFKAVDRAAMDIGIHNENHNGFHYGLEYLNFHIRLTANNGNALQKVIINSPAGHGEYDVQLPLHDAGFQEMVESLWNVLLNLRSSFRATPQQEKVAQAVGNTLFTSLFRDEILQLYDDSLRKANELPEAGLLLRFEIEEPALATLPWELLYDGRKNQFLAVHRDTPIVRTLPQLQRDLPPLTTQPLRMLCMVANPVDYAHLDAKHEKQYLHEALQELENDGSIEIHWVAGQTWHDLQYAMRTNEWHIFHFTGHGSLDQTAEDGKGSLTFVSEHGGPQILTAEQVAQLLSGHSSLRLVIINASEGARKNAQDIFSSIAATLLSQCRSLMAVLTMQTKITDSAAILFTSTFYAALANGVPVETAVTEARVAINITMPSTFEWATPVLYTHSPFPILFTMKQAQRIEAGKLQYTCHDIGGIVRSIAWSPDGKFIASSSDNGPVQIRESTTGAVLTSYRYHSSAVQTVAWSPIVRGQEEQDSTVVASASLDGSIHIWNAATGQQRLKLTLHRIPSLDPLTITIAWSPDGKFIAAGSNNEQVKIWNAETGQLTKTYREHSHSGSIVPKLGWILALAWSPDGRYIVSGGGGYNLKSTGFGESWLFDKNVHIWDAHTGKRISTYDAHTKSVTSLAWSPDGRFIASADRNGQVHVWEPDSQTPAHIFGEHKKIVNALLWSPDSSCLASASDDTTVRIWHAATGNELYTYTGHTSNVNAIAWSPDGKSIASGGHEKTIHVWQAPSTHVRTTKNEPVRANANPPGISYVRQGDLLYTYDTHANWVSAVAWSPDGTRIASGGGDATVRIWNPATGENLLTYHGQAGRLSEVLAVAWSPDSTRIASGGNRATIQVWDADSKQLRAQYEGHSKFAGVPYIGHVFWAAWSPDGKSIASTSINLGLDKAVHIWNATTGRLIRKLDLHSGLVDTSSAGGVAWSPDGTRIAAGMSKEVRIYDVKTGAQILTYKQQSGYISTVAWSPDGERIASMDSTSVHVWNATTGDFYYAYKGHAASLRDVAWSPNGHYLASASNDRTVQLWTARDGTRLFTYTGHNDEVGAVSWAPDSQRIASASKDKTVQVWWAI